MKKSKLFAMMALGAVLFAGSTVGLSTAAHAALPFPVGFQYNYAITNVNSGKAMDVEFDSLNAGTHLDQWDWLNIPSQKWKILPTSDGFTYTIQNLNSGLLVECTTYGNPGNIQQSYPNPNAPQQKWVISPVGDAYTIRNYQSGTVLDIEYNKTDNGWHVQGWQYIPGVMSQLWRFAQVS